MAVSALVVAFMHQPHIPHKPSHFTRDQMTAPGMFIVAHRGGAMEGWDNSFSAIKHAHEVGVHGIHVDIRRTNDGVYVLHHEDSLWRTTGQERHISESTYEEIGHYQDHIDNGFGETYHHENTEKEKPPKFEEVLHFFTDTDEVIFISDHTDHWKHTFEILTMIKNHGLMNRVVFHTTQNWDQIRSKFGHSISSWSGHENMEWTYEHFFNGDFFDHPEKFHWDVFHTTWNFHTIQQSPWFEHENDFVFSEDHEFKDFVHGLEERKTSVQLMNHTFRQHGIPVTYWAANHEKDWHWAMEIGAHAIFTDKPAEAWLFKHNWTSSNWQGWNHWQSHWQNHHWGHW